MVRIKNTIKHQEVNLISEVLKEGVVFPKEVEISEDVMIPLQNYN